MEFNKGPDLNGVSAYQTLVERRNWLVQRITAKSNVGWDTEYDQREHDALCWALDTLKGV